MSALPDAWDDEWSTAADTSAQPADGDAKKRTTKQTKAQKRAAQAEFNRQLWADAEGPRETNYFLESRNVVPLRQEFKAPTMLLSRKGPPIVQKTKSSVEEGIQNLNLKDREESSEDEDEEAAKQKALAQAKIQAAKDREEKQRKYEERRLELFGPDASGSSSNPRPNSQSGGSTPNNLTPPGSRSSTPHRGGKRGRGRGSNQNNPPRQQYQAQAQQQQLREVYDPGYAAKPNSPYLMRREQSLQSPNKEGTPLREPKAPDGSPGFAWKRRSLQTVDPGQVQTFQPYRT